MGRPFKPPKTLHFSDQKRNMTRDCLQSEFSEKKACNSTEAVLLGTNYECKSSHQLGTEFVYSI